MPWSSPTREVDRDLAALGRGQRIMSAINLALFVAIIVLYNAYQPANLVGATLAIVGASTIVLLSFRVRVRLKGDVLEVRGHIRTTRIPLSNVMVFVDLPYQGWWGGYSPLAFPGVWQIDVETESGRSRSFPATMCSKSRAARLANSLNALFVEDEVTELPS